MTSIEEAVAAVVAAAKASEKPLAVILAGHNGSGKSSMWYGRLSDTFKIPLINADRMMLSVLPEPVANFLPDWAQVLRDTDVSWMTIAQQGVNSFVAHAMGQKSAFAIETVFSYWEKRSDGSRASKIDLILQLQAAGYFVLLIFVGLADVQLSIGRVSTRFGRGGHNVEVEKLVQRFPRTQAAVKAAQGVPDAAILTDNSRTPRSAFTVVRVELAGRVDYDIRADRGSSTPPVISVWLGRVRPFLV